MKGKMKMKLGLKEKIEAIETGYTTNNEAQEKEIRKIVEPYKLTGLRYTPDGLRQEVSEKLKPVMDEWKNYDIVLNQNLNAAIAEAKKKLVKAIKLVEAKKKPADYATRISNAIQFVNIAIENSNPLEIMDKEFAAAIDVELFTILKEFMDDDNTMKRFRLMVEKKFPGFINANGECVFPKTFGGIGKSSNILDTMDEMEAAAKELFTQDREETNKEILRVKDVAFSVPAHPYTTLADIEKVKNCAVILDGLAEEFDVEGLSNSTDEGTKTETEGQFTEGQNFDANGHPYTASNTAEGGDE